MAVCDYCNQEMMTADGCTAAPIVIDGWSYPPIRLGQESYPWRMSRCGDCRVRLGEVHHHGCDIEECPACRGQSISCGCRWAGEDDEDEEALDGDALGDDALDEDTLWGNPVGPRIPLLHVPGQVRPRRA